MKFTRKNKNTKSKRHNTTKKVYSKTDFNSGDGMLTSVWGPSLWHSLHTMSFNYPTNPTNKQKIHYRNFVLNLQYVLPCKYCRMNLVNNFKALPLKMSYMKNRETFSRYVYELHELINRMLGKKSGLTYEMVQERYEHFRARCTETKKKQQRVYKFKKEKGCTEPLYGKKAKCVIKIIPQDKKEDTFQMSKQCIKKRIDNAQPMNSDKTEEQKIKK